MTTKNTKTYDLHVRVRNQGELCGMGHLVINAEHYLCVEIVSFSILVEPKLFVSQLLKLQGLL